MKKFFTVVGLLTAVIFACGVAEAGLINPDFELGDLTGWTTFNTANGVSYPTVTMFDVNNDSTSSYAARFQVGNAVYSGQQEGGGIYQDIALLAGSVSIDADIASYCSQGSNMGGGVFSLYIDDLMLAQYNFGEITTGSKEYATLSGSTTVTEGTHTVKFLMTRKYTTGTTSGYTPYQYIDNIVLNAAEQEIPDTTTIPEPMSMLLFASGLAGFAGLKRKK